MKKYLKNFEITYEFVRCCIYECLNRRRWTRRDTSWLFADYTQLWQLKHNYKFKSKYYLSKKIRNIAYENKHKLDNLVDFIAFQIYTEIKERRIELDKIRYEFRIDGASKKTREIGISSMKQQFYDYIAVNSCKKMFLAKIGHYQCASLKFKGQLFGKSAIETWIRTNPQKCQWIFKGDIKKFYPNINHKILKDLLTRDIKNNEILYLLFTLIDTYKEGLCIGSYLSQFLANYYLSYAYHYVTEFLYTERRGKRINLVNYVLFYMDDIILFGSSKKNVKMASKKLEKYLNEKLDLHLKSTYQLFPLDSRPIDMMGFKIWTYKTTVRERIFVRANKVFRKVNKNERITLEQARKIVSYYGYFKYSYSYKYTKKVGLENTLKKAKEVISYANRNVYRKVGN